MPSSTYPLEDLPGMTADYASQLSGLGLTNTQQLYRLGQSPPHCQALAARLKLPQRYITKWVVLSALAQVPGVGCEYNGLLLHAGISSIEQLAQSSPQGLYPRIKRLHVATMRRSDLCPAPDQVSLWIQNAKAILTRQRPQPRQ
jgi:predicted RecB family nuclease